MANPYHDETGKFCSKGEMGAAVERLTKSGKLEQASQLLQEFREIEDIAKAEKVLKKLSPERIEESGALADNLLSRTSLGGNIPARVGDQVFTGIDDSRLEEVDALLTKRADDFKENVLTPAQEQEQIVLKELEAEAGVTSMNALHAEARSAFNETEAEGKKIIRDIQGIAIANGVPDGYARYYFDKAQTQLGLREDGYNTFNNTTIPRASEFVALNKDAIYSGIQDKTKREVISQAIDSYLDENKDKVEAYNNKAAKTNELKATEKRFDKKLGMDYVQKKYRNENMAARFSDAKKAVASQVAWRKELRNAGIDTNNVATSSVSKLNAASIKVNSDGKVNNVWVVREDETTGARSAVRVSSVATENGQSALVDESGKQYAGFTHYHSYRSSNTDYNVIVDETKSGSSPYSGLSFHSSLDSGD